MTAAQDFLRVQQANEKLIADQLHDAAKSIDREIKKISSKAIRSSSSNVRIAQYQMALSEIRNTLSNLWQNDIGPTIADGILDVVDEAAMMNVLTGPIIASTGMSQATWEAAQRQTARNNIEAYRQRVEGNSYQPLSNRVYRNSELSKGMVDRAVNNALIAGKSARELALDVRGLIDPDVRGGVSYAAMRLGRSELNNAFHATTIGHHGSKPWVKGLLWNLSLSHRGSDTCDDYAGKTYTEMEAPAKPHPHCFCYLTPQTISEDEFVRRFHNGEFDAELSDLTGPPLPTASAVPAGKKVSSAKIQPTEIKAEPKPVEFRPLSHEQAVTQLATFTAPQKAAIGKYTDKAYKPVNARLRGETSYDTEGFSVKSTEAITNTLDSAMKPLPVDAVVHRYVVNVSRIGGGKTYDDLIPGDLLQDKGFASTTLVEDGAASYLGNMHLVIQAPKGVAKGAYLDPYSNHGGEYELLLARGSKFRVVEVVSEPGDYGTTSKTITLRIEE